MLNSDWTYLTDRLLVKEWHSFASDEWRDQDLAVIVKGILTPRVTHSLPPSWQGSYTLERAEAWIAERDDEGVALLAIEKSSGNAIGIILLFEAAKDKDGSDLRLGYMLGESSWRKGFASELVNGFVAWCQDNKIKSVTGGVERDSIASRRVLEKCGFMHTASDERSGDQLFVLKIPFRSNNL
ncbi:GNAT family N-acetyltransferase [Marinobacterium jannaschii]|uniref:GNAT family N-acetyltransferase n=1 Tax=Marinobacterium jannaschii TaxID=64970 RepID=UPI000686213E|nr:GNAT family N-acetyltransferase [Marinobacterium jannaschii]